MRLRLLSAAFIIMAACTGKQNSAPSASQAEKNSGSRVVNLFIWSRYIADEVVQNFEKKTGIHIQISNFSSNEELLAKLQAGASGYDVIVPSDYMVAVMIKLGLLQELNRQQLPNLGNLTTFVTKRPYDPENKFSIPYAWTTTGLAVNKSLFKGEIKSWKDAFENPALAGKISLLDDVREVMGAALKMNGFSLNSVKKEELEKAKKALLQVRKRVRSFNSEPLMAIMNGEVAVSHIYSSDANQAAIESKGKIVYIVPSEGATLSIDNLAIPKTAPHQAEAHALINYLLQAKVNATLVQHRYIGPVVTGVEELLPTQLRMNKGIFPDAPVLANCEMMRDLAESTAVYDRIWTEIKAAQ